MRPVITVSHSDITQFQRCRRAWLWGYVEDRNEPDRLVGALALGTRVHAALEAWYGGQVTHPVEMHDHLVHRDYATLEASSPASWEIEQFYDDARVGRNCINAYMDWLAETGEDQDLEVQAVESTIEVPFLDGRVLLRAKVDVTFRRITTGGLVQRDFKTTGRALSVARAELERSYQLRMYDLIQSLLTPAEIVEGGEYAIIKKATKRQRGKPEVERFAVPGLVRQRDMTREHLEGICLDMLRLLAEMGTEPTERLFYPTPAESCSWCQFRHPCMIYQDNPEAGQQMLDVEFSKGRHARYEVG